MEVILLEKIQNLGDLGDVVNVRPGYARNYLVPQKKAVRATADAKQKVEERRKELAEADAARLADSESRAADLPSEVVVKRRASDEGKLFGSVSPVDISELLATAEIEVQRSEISMPEGPIKELGEHEIEVIFHPEVRRPLKVIVEGED